MLDKFISLNPHIASFAVVDALNHLIVALLLYVHIQSLQLQLLFASAASVCTVNFAFFKFFSGEVVFYDFIS